MAPQLEPFFKQVDGLAESFIERLRKAVAIPSVSAQDENRKDVFRMAQFLASELEALGAEVHQRPLGKQPGKEHLDLPPVVIARYGNDKNKRTILVYGHYDVQPALKEDGWATEPFQLTVDNQGRMYGRGSTDDKGPVLGWLNVIEAHRKAGVELPVNLLCCFEGMEEYGSEGLEEFIQAESKGFFKDADAVCISDNYWLGTEKPCLTYGLRGCNYYSVGVTGPAQDLHSGVFGGSAHEPMTDLVHVMSKLVDTHGNILIPGIMDLVEPLTEEEKALYPNISYTMDDLHQSLGSKTSIHPTKERTLMARWRYPSLSLHGIEGAYSAPGAKTVIPAKVIGKFSIRTVPNMESEDVNKLVFDYIKAEFAKLNSKNTLDVWLQHDGKWWVASPKHWNFTAAGKAVKQVFGVEPDMTREGGSVRSTEYTIHITQSKLSRKPNSGHSRDSIRVSSLSEYRRKRIRTSKSPASYEGTGVSDSESEGRIHHSITQALEYDEDELELRATQLIQEKYSFAGDEPNVPAEHGILERVECYNFMCHDHFYVELGPLINFIVGKNGSGKSAVLTAITLCLGGKASATNRGQSLKSFIKEGKESATIVVRIKNQGDGAYMPDDYGKSIVIERHFTKAGTSGFKIKAENGRIVSTKKAELDAIIDFFTLQFDNPMNVLSQDMARQFLSSSSPAEKYKFFVKGVQLEQLDQDYRLIEESADQIEEKLRGREQDIMILKHRKVAANQKLDMSDQHESLRNRVRNVRSQMAWAQVEEQERVRSPDIMGLQAGVSDEPVQRDVVADLRRKLSDQEERFRSARSRLEGCKQARVRHGKSTNELRVILQRKEDHVEELTDVLDKERVEDDHLDVLRATLQEAEEEKRINEGSLKDSMEAMEAMMKGLKAIKQQLASKDADIAASTEELHITQSEVLRAQDKRRKIINDKNIAVERLDDIRREKERINEKREEVSARVIDFSEKASLVSPRVPIPEAYDRALKQVEEFRLLAGILIETLKHRKKRWVIFRSHISSRAKAQFTYLLSERSFRGRLLTDHESKLLDLQVEPDITKDSTGRGAKTLSGGEKSFSQVCLLLALWEAMGSPVRCLDEFDVYMDHINRKMAIDMLMLAARRSVGVQFILITPGSRAEISLAPDVRVKELAEPERGQTRLVFRQ
ncbi:hypothetical protein BDV35DRAFT_381620 [Aspergillus flavus]|uniref:Uncharacterized protein n=1 Tax=Aspergillus flavus TaxID=5059 RepID=A0A5N6GTH9_ASPFL|nr:hypothetical protein BDV35DRAFT_381620 [Aspergillus flavus]